MKARLSVAVLLLVAGATASAAQDQEEFVRNLYRHVLDREGTRGEVSMWARHLHAGTTNPDEMRAGFLGSDEFYKKYGRDARKFVFWGFVNVFGRRPSDAELQHWGGRYWSLGGNRIALAREMIQEAHRAPPPPPPAPPPPEVVVVRALPVEPVPVAQPNVEIVAQAEASVVLVEVFLSGVEGCRRSVDVSTLTAEARKLQTSLERVRSLAAQGVHPADLRGHLRDVYYDLRILRQRRQQVQDSAAVAVPSLADVTEGIDHLGHLLG
jgi:hypothetical protein